MKFLRWLACVPLAASTPGRWLILMAALADPLQAATYHVTPRAANASDANPGTAQATWKTIARAGSAGELKPGDEVRIGPGVYREHAQIKVSGEPGRPITFAAGSQPWESARRMCWGPAVPRSPLACVNRGPGVRHRGDRRRCANRRRPKAP